MLEARTAAPAPALAPTVLAPAEAPKPLLAPAVEDAIAARSYDPTAERLSRQYALQMAAKGMDAKAIVQAIQRGALPPVSVDEELAGVVS